MMIRVNGLHDAHALRLGVQTNRGHTTATALWKANQWAPKKARSFTITLEHTEYDGRPAPEETGYAIATVRYFTTRKEGDCPVDREAPSPDTRTGAKHKENLS